MAGCSPRAGPSNQGRVRKNALGLPLGYQQEHEKMEDTIFECEKMLKFLQYFVTDEMLGDMVTPSNIHELHNKLYKTLMVGVRDDSRKYVRSVHWAELDRRIEGLGKQHCAPYLKETSQRLTRFREGMTAQFRTERIFTPEELEDVAWHEFTKISKDLLPGKREIHLLVKKGCATLLGHFQEHNTKLHQGHVCIMEHEKELNTLKQKFLTGCFDLRNNIEAGAVFKDMPAKVKERLLKKMKKAVATVGKPDIKLETVRELFQELKKAQERAAEEEEQEDEDNC